jgi:hypothetical protein
MKEDLIFTPVISAEKFAFSERGLISIQHNQISFIHLLFAYMLAKPPYHYHGVGKENQAALPESYLKMGDNYTV